MLSVCCKPVVSTETVVVLADRGLEPIDDGLGVGDVQVDIERRDLGDDLALGHRRAFDQLDRLDAAVVGHRDQVGLGQPRLAFLVDVLADAPRATVAASTGTPARAR